MSFRRNDCEYLEGKAIPASNLSKEKIEDYAVRVAEALDFEPNGNLVKLIKTRLEGRVHYQDLSEWLEGESGSVFVHGKNDFDICLAKYTSPLRDRFTMGHELGHYLLHSQGGVRPIIASRCGSTRIEWEANWFSASFLMPETEFKAALEEHPDEMAYVASLFGMSLDAAKVRRKSLNV